MVTGKNKKQFKKFYDNIKGGNYKIPYENFMAFPFEMQLGVYLAYYEDKIEINAISYDNEFYWKAICNHELNKRHDTRNEAYKEAFKQADKLLNVPNN